MAPARFSQVSRYRNATLTQAKPDERFSELSLGSTPDSGSGKLLAVSPTSSHIFARSSTSPSALIVLPHSATRKYGKQPPLFHNASSGQLGDFDVCHFQDNDEEVLLAAGSLQGDVTVQRVKLPLHNVPSDQTASVTLPAQDPSPALFKTPTSKAIVLLSFHPTSSPLFLTASNQESTIDIWDSNRSSSVIHFDGGSSHWDAKWSPDGRQLAAYDKDAKVRLWDPRNATECVVVSTKPPTSEGK
jgi:WD40 repeat protein